MKTKRYILSAAFALVCFMIVVTTIVVNGPGHTRAATLSPTTVKAVSPSKFDGVYGNVYYGSNATSYFALNATTGALLWRYKFSGNLISSNLDHIHYIVYLGSDNNTAYALDSRTGSLLWAYHVNSPVYRWPAPTMNSILYLITNTDIYALNADHGGLLWHYSATTNTNIGSNWSLVNGAVYFVTSDGIVHALAASNGASLWQQSLGASGGIYAVTNGVVYLITDRQYTSADSIIYALNATKGSILWHYTLQNTRWGNGAFLTIINHRLYATSDFNHGNFGLTLLNAATGSLLWPKPPTTGAFLDTGSIEPFTVIQGVMYFNTYWAVYAVSVSDGKTLWSYQPQDDVAKMTVYNNVVYLHHGIYESGPVTAHNASDGTLLWTYQPPNASSMLSIVNGAMYLDSSNNLYTVNTGNGKLLWSATAAVTNLNILNGIVYFDDTNTSTIFALNAATGATLWKFAAAASHMSITGGIMYFDDANTSIFFALNATTGATLWKHRPAISQVYQLIMVMNGIVYIQPQAYSIFAFDESTGKLLWKYPAG